MRDNQDVNASTTELELTKDVPIYDANGEKLDTISENCLQGSCLVLHEGVIFPRDVYVPLSAVQSSDANGVRLSMTRAELMHERYATPNPGSTIIRATLVSRGTDVIDRNEPLISKGTDVIERDEPLISKGTDVIDRDEGEV